MKNISILLILFLLLLISESFAQTVPTGSGCSIYEVQPGTKGNEITLTVANISETNSAANVNVVLTKKSSSLSFNKEEEMIELIEAKTEAEAKFIFDVERNVPINKKDTIEFMITSSDGMWNIRHPDGITKQFIFSYIGPKEFKLEQNFPNPFNPITRIQYQISASPKSILRKESFGQRRGLL